MNAEAASYIELVGAGTSYDLSAAVDVVRSNSDEISKKYSGDHVYEGSQEDLLVGADEASKVPVSVLRPLSDKPLSCIMIYFHGGGWVLSSRATHMSFCQLISQHCNCVVVNVEYRLAPEHKFPACYEDAEQVVRWCLDNKQYLAKNEQAKLGVAGDSAGGNIAGSVCHLVTGIDYQVLIYPILTLVDHTSYPSYKKYCEGYLFTSDMMTWFRSHFLGDMNNAYSELASPMLRTSFSNLPVSLFIVAECDLVCDQSADYKEKLEAAGVRCELLLLEGAVHGFVNKPGHFKQTTAKMIQKMGEFLAKI